MLTRRHLFSSTAAVVLGITTRALAQSTASSVEDSSDRVRIKRRFVRVGDRHVHYLRAGSGPPVVLIHASPSDSSTFIGQLLELGKKYTCFAFDTPGFGRSDPLPEGKMNATDIGASVAETMQALNLPPCPVFGTHTGAAVTLEMAVQHPERVTGLILDGIPIFNDEELDDFDGYFAPLEIDSYGGHLSATWTRFRDTSLWFPWQIQSPAFSNGRAPSPAVSIHSSVMRFYLCAKNYAPAYRSAVFYGKQAVKSAAALDVPAVMMAISSDVLFPHLDRLPPLKPNQEIVKLGADRREKDPVSERAFTQFDEGHAAPEDTLTLAGSNGVGKQFVDLPSSQVMVRYSGDPDGDPIVILHDAPGSSHALEPLIEQLGKSARVVALDLPGCGESGPLPGDAPSIMDYASAVADVCGQLGINAAGLYGIGFGASVAIAVKARSPDLVKRLALHGVLLPGAEERAVLRANYAPPIVIQDNGSHWYDTWMMLRDSLIMWPWYTRNADGRRQMEQDFDGDKLHDWTFEVMKQRETYHHVINAAIDYHANDALAQISGPVLNCTDAAHRFAVYDGRLQSLIPDADILTVSTDVNAHANGVVTFLKG
jgi:pimeloyl-ACP methyl ester carboxylesterase